MTRRLIPTALSLALFGVPALTGCDRTVSEEHTTVRKSDGTVTQQQKKVEKQSDGTLKETTKEKTVNP